MSHYSKRMIEEAKRLTCGHCHSLFAGTPAQAYNSRNRGQKTYCSNACRHAAQCTKPKIEHGPCETCGAMFMSRRPKPFCSMTCYTASPRFRAMLEANRDKIGARPGVVMSPEMRAKIAEKLRTGEMAECLECRAEVYVKKGQTGKRKFCSTVCYRAYMAKRFDRWVASPEQMALPQCYDEFLDRHELPCLVAGCNWRGLSLTAHMNFAHGVKREDFKRAAGFNLHTGVIAKPLAESLQGRELVGIAAVAEAFPEGLPRPTAVQRYKSLEGKEHYVKGRALRLAEPGPMRVCHGCGIIFQQSSVFGRAKYCSAGCRDERYRELKVEQRARKR